jgi:hypothetical protein
VSAAAPAEMNAYASQSIVDSFRYFVAARFRSTCDLSGTFLIRVALAEGILNST